MSCTLKSKKRELFYFVQFLNSKLNYKRLIRIWIQGLQKSGSNADTDTEPCLNEVDDVILEDTRLLAAPAYGEQLHPVGLVHHGAQRLQPVLDR